MVFMAVIAFIVCGLVLYLYREEISEHKLQKQEMLTESVLTEAEMVILDFLDYGKEVSIATKGKYQGTVSFRLQSRKDGTIGFCVSMYDCGDLRMVEEWILEELHLKGFVKKYGHAYDPDRDSIRYQTSRSLKPHRQDKEELEKLLSRRIRNHPLAILKSDTVICTRGI